MWLRGHSSSPSLPSRGHILRHCKPSPRMVLSSRRHPQGIGPRCRRWSPTTRPCWYLGFLRKWGQAGASHLCWCQGSLLLPLVLLWCRRWVIFLLSLETSLEGLEKVFHFIRRFLKMSRSIIACFEGVPIQGEDSLLSLCKTLPFNAGSAYL